MAVLPGHTLLLEGKGSEAIRLSALGSAGSVALALLIAAPMSLLFGLAYPLIQSHMALLLILVVLIMLVSEKGEFVPGQGSLAHWKSRFYALLVFLVSGSLGLIAFKLEYLMQPLLSLGEPSILLPLLSGLFGSSQLIISMLSNPVIPAQLPSRIELERKRIFRGIMVGGISGSLVAWLPGISSSIATVFARLFIKQEFSKPSHAIRSLNDETDLAPSKEFIVSVSGVNTCNAIFGLFALAVISRSRNGAMVAVNELLGDISLNSSNMLLFLCVISLTAILSYFSTIFLGDNIHRSISKIDYSLLAYTVIAVLAIMSLLFTGLFGLMIFIVATPVGMLAPFLKIRKSHAMGVILLPVILYFI
ncbi:tripartite tricarboxylate transporter permease [Methanolobus sp. ZRKC3]|uniref:tripartite tricarboxylate transporter permease n=1 Tax=Methanolobus sp. ZRKC3 TaxID=3125786 RepID=UPI0032501338